jgi:PAS domain S-box-containing protein
MDDVREASMAGAMGEVVVSDIDRFYRTLARDAADAIIYADAEGRIAFWNKAAERIFGFSETEALGRTLDIIIPEKLRDRHNRGFSEAVRTGKTRYGTGHVLAVPAVRRDGTHLSIEFTILPFRDRAGRILGIAATLRDVTAKYEKMKASRPSPA